MSQPSKVRLGEKARSSIKSNSAPRIVASAAAAASSSSAPTPPASTFVWNGAKPLPLALSIGLGLALRFLIPVPDGIGTRGWTLLSVFVSTIAGLVLEPLPVGAWAFLAATTAVATKTLTFQATFSAFTNDVIWLIVVSFFFARVSDHDFFIYGVVLMMLLLELRM